MLRSKRLSPVRSLLWSLVVFGLLLGACAPGGATPAPGATTAPGNTPAPGDTPAPAATTPPSAPLTEDRLVPPLDFPFSSAAHDPVRNEIGMLLAQEWESLGMRVNTMPMDFAGYNAIVETGEGFHAFIGGLVSRPERLDPDVLLYRTFYSGLQTNWHHYSDPDYDRVVGAQRTEMDIETRREYVYEAQEILARDLPAISLYHVSEVHFYNNVLFEDPVPMLGQGLYNIWNLLDIKPRTNQRILNVGEVEQIDTANPFGETRGANVETLRMVYDLLARVGPDGIAVPWAAESWDVIDSTTVQVNLRRDMQFHDGVPVTASDVKFSYDIQKEEGASIYKPFLNPIDNIELVDDYTLIFHLVNPYPALFQATFAQIFILPEHIWSQVPSPRSDAVVDKPLGSGPFIFEQWIVGEEVRLPANKDHFHAPQIDGIIIVNFANPDSLFLSLVNQQIHMHDRRLLPAAIEQASAHDHLTRVDLADFGVYYVGFNLNGPPFDAHVFRRAMGHLVNWDVIVNVILDGYGEPGRGFIAPANRFWHNPDVVYPEYNPALARQMLQDAGYEWDAQGRLYLPPN
jgi:peptide/nickel transport system substrate-binding protein